MHVATAFAAALRMVGVERVYGLPGEDHLRLLDALPAGGITYIGARDETSAVLMAATEAAASGVPGVVLVTLGPGITNAINGIAHAWLDHVPLLVVSGQHPPDRVIVRQHLDAHRLLDSITKATITASPRIHQVLARALQLALSAPAGPVYLELRDDVAAADVVDDPRQWPVLPPTRLGGGPPETVPKLVAAARRPIAIAGANCPTDARTRAAIAALTIPTFTTPSAIGLRTSDDPWFAGTFMNGNLESALIDLSDCILTLGLDARDFFNATWRYSAPVVAINELPETQGFAPIQQQLVGETAPILEALSTASTWTPDDIADYRATVTGAFEQQPAAFTIPAALRLTRSILPATTRIAVDAGFGKPLASYLWTACEPTTYFTAHGLSTMGFALPAANALAILDPQRPAVGFMGDGSLLMRASEISVAVEQGVAPIYVAWMDAALAQIETKQLRQHLRSVGARLPDLECARIADAFGGRGVDVASLEDFGDALETALRSSKPTLIGAQVDQSCRGEWYELLRG